MSKEITPDKIFDQRLLKIFDQFRGVLTAESTFSLFLQLFFYKFLEDNHGEIWIEKTAHQLKFPDQYRLANLVSSDRKDNLSETFSKALLAVETANDPLLVGVFLQSDLSYFERSHDKRAGRVLLELISVINTFNFNQKYLAGEGIAFSAIFTGLLDRLAETELRRSGGFIIPKSLRELLAGLSQVYSRTDETVYDPACGAGTLLMEVAQCSKSKAFAQERNMNFSGLAKMQWIINGQDPDRIAVGDALNYPHFLEQGQLRQFDKVVSCPPFGISRWGAERAAVDQYHRFDWGVPPASRADYAYIQHAIASLKPNGTAFLVSIAGVLFRGGAEEQIRKKMIDNNIINAIISLPAGLFNLWNIPLCILCLNKARQKQKKGLLMVDLASYPNQLRDKEGLNTRTNNHVVESVARFFVHQEVVHQDEIFCRIVTKEEIAANDYNLNIARYFASGGKANIVDPKKIAKEITLLERDLSELDLKIGKLKKQLKLS